MRRELKDKGLNDATRANLIREAISKPLAASADKSAKNIAQLLTFSAEVRDLLGHALLNADAS